MSDGAVEIHNGGGRNRGDLPADTAGGSPDESAGARRGLPSVLMRVKQRIKQDDVSLLAAGVAFYGLLAMVPAMVAFVSVYGLVADPDDIRRNVDDVLAAAPTEVQDLVRSQLESIVESSSSGLRLGALIGVAVALWSASAGVKNLMTAVNRAYHEDEGRGFVRLRGTAVLLTIALLVLGGIGLGIVIAPQALGSSGGEGLARDVLMIARWPLAGLVLIVALALLYRFAPDRDGRWRWTSAGAVLATIVWLVASVGFSIYTANFSNYNETYGALGAIVVVMLWLWISAFAVIAGAELNAELEARPSPAVAQSRARPEPAPAPARARSEPEPAVPTASAVPSDAAGSSGAAGSPGPAGSSGAAGSPGPAGSSGA
ncbi:MAG TPA: YihY/virulence factor BrkB family protein, partial [Acidimicrobiales bacterium]